VVEKSCLIPLGKRSTYLARVSQHRYAALTKWRWNWKMSAWKYGAKVYARRGGGILRELMGVPQPSPSHTVHHKNGDSLDDTDDNLCWATKSVQSAEQKPRIPTDMRAAIDEARVAA
jgi:hypothetical protein